MLKKKPRRKQGLEQDTECRNSFKLFFSVINMKFLRAIIHRKTRPYNEIARTYRRNLENSKISIPEEAFAVLERTLICYFEGDELGNPIDGELLGSLQRGRNIDVRNNLRSFCGNFRDITNADVVRLLNDPDEQRNLRGFGKERRKVLYEYARQKGLEKYIRS